MQTYWTLFLTESLGPSPHSGLCHGQFTSPDALWHDLREKGWTSSSFRSHRAKVARITLNRTGFRVRLFESLAAAKRFEQSLLKPTPA